jgi:hypothetical protein
LAHGHGGPGRLVPTSGKEARSRSRASITDYATGEIHRVIDLGVELTVDRAEWFAERFRELTRSAP